MPKQIIRNEVSNFLGKTQNTSSFSLTNQSQYYTAALSGTELNEQKALTGAAPAILPMKISTVGVVPGHFVSAVPGGNIRSRIEFTLLINPTTWNHGKTQAAQSVYARPGWKVQLWGPNQDTISSTGRTAATYLPGIGLDNFVQEASFAYLDLLSLVGAYRTNGYFFMDQLDINNKFSRVIDTVSGVEIQYDGGTFLGHFNNFTLDESEENPYLFDYNFEFVTSAFDEAEYEIRGHYKPLPPSVTSDENASDQNLVGDVYTFEDDLSTPTFQLTPPKPVEDQTTIRLWERITGFPFNMALSFGLTNNTVQGNLHLRQKLYTMTWNPTTHKFS